MKTRVALDNPVVQACLIAFGLHGLLILAGIYHLSYDAYNHLFFADHYARDWWSLWEPRWYTGFEITSYPPLVHQLIALLGRLIGLDLAFALILWALLSLYPAGVYAFSRVFTGRRAARWAAFGAALLPSIYLTAHNFGQLPTLFSGLLILFGTAALAGFLRSGSPLEGLLAISLFVTAAAGHHASLMFGACLAGAVLVHAGQYGGRDWLRTGLRFGLFALPAASLALAVVWPFWEWGRGQSLQAPIDHLSRHNFIQDPFAAVLFFLPMYGLLIPFLPLAMRTGMRRRRRALGAAFLLLFLLGLGNTTPLPRWIFRNGWAWLTYDRFAFWASLLLLPLLGLAAAPALRRVRLQSAWPAFAGLLVLTALLTGTSPAWLPTQPAQVDMQPIVDFLEEPQHNPYRYITLGMGDQLAYLSRLTTATTIDGSYHTARGLPELRSSGIGQIDTAFWIPGGLQALGPILDKSGQRGVRWAFVAMKIYIPVLVRSGWVRLEKLKNGIEVWENPRAALPPPVTPPPESPFTSFSWGVFPLLAAYCTALLSIRRLLGEASRPVLAGVRRFAAGLLPLGLTLWYFRSLFSFPHAKIYFAYSDALFFAADGLALAAVLAWLVERLPLAGQPLKPPAWRIDYRRPDDWLLGLCLLSSLSTTWSLDWRTAVYLSLHLWLCFGLYLALKATPQAWRWFALGCAAALSLQALIAAGELAAQSTAFTHALGLLWPGVLRPADSGASVIQLENGTRWLRAYGALPHPNLLGGFALALLVAPLALFLSPRPHPERAGDGRSRRMASEHPSPQPLSPSGRGALWSVHPEAASTTLSAHPERSRRMERSRRISSRWLTLLFINAGLFLVAASFSRSAWLGLAVLGAGLLAQRLKLAQARLAVLGTNGFAAAALLVVFAQPLILPRLGAAQVQTEQVSNYTRMWLVERTLELIQRSPLTGVGLGSYSLALRAHVASFYEIEPVHNLPLLVMSELGAGGLILLAGLALAIAAGWRRASHPAAIVLHAGLLGLMATSLFDHYFWTLAPGRLLFFTLLGLWAGALDPGERGAAA